MPAIRNCRHLSTEALQRRTSSVRHTSTGGNVSCVLSVLSSSSPGQGDVSTVSLSVFLRTQLSLFLVLLSFSTQTFSLSLSVSLSLPFRFRTSHTRGLGGRKRKVETRAVKALQELMQKPALKIQLHLVSYVFHKLLHEQTVIKRQTNPCSRLK